MLATEMPTAALLSEALDVPTSVLSGWRKRGIGNYPSLFALCESRGINIHWLMTGEGSMLQSSTQVAHEVPNGGIPLVSVEALGGLGNAEMVINERDVLDRYHVPDFKDVTFMLYLKGESMAPSYMAGDLIACRQIHEHRFIMWGRAYLLATRSHGIIVKRLFPGTTPGHLTCRSDNPAYPSFEVPEQDEIDGLALVVGLIRID